MFTYHQAVRVQLEVAVEIDILISINLKCFMGALIMSLFREFSVSFCAEENGDVGLL